jgi:hypothetical protein
MMPFALAQPWKVYADSSLEAKVTLDSVATAGNLLIVALAHRRVDATTNPAVSGFTRVANLTDNTGGNKGVALFWKVAVGGEQTFTAENVAFQWKAIAAAEFTLPSGSTGVSFYQSATYTSGGTSVASATVNVPNPGTASSLAWVQSFARDANGSAFDSGFATPIADSIAGGTTEFSVSWRDDAQGVAGNNVTVTHSAATQTVMASGVWTAVGAAPVATPSGFTHTATGLQLDGAWSAVAGADSYDWEVERDNAGTWVAFESGNTATLAFQLDDTDGVAFATTYRGRVRTDDGGVKSDWTGWVSATTPADALAISGTQTEAVSLSWNATVSPYDIRRNGTTTIASGLTGTSYVDTDVTAGTTYTYEVRSDGGAWSEPTSVAVVAGGGGVFFLTPDDPSGWSV